MLKAIIFFSLTSPKSEIMEEDCEKIFVQIEILNDKYINNLI
jgi:hypothetical protein